MKKVIFTLNVDGYSPEITKITYPFIEHYAKKIGAEIYVINKRRFKDYPVTYEKLQIYELGLGYDWIIYIDSDALIHPNMFDVTELLPQDTVMTYDKDFAVGRFGYDRYFKRDGRNIGVGNLFTIASKWCIDLWNPLREIEYASFIINMDQTIYPTRNEQLFDILPTHLIDDYVLSRNIAKYGLKHTTFLEYFKEYIDPLTFLHHNYLLTTEEKIIDLQNVANTF
jgi:hypothetical protein